MKSFDEDTHSFLVRVRPEENKAEGSSELRGNIEHLPSKKSRSLKDLEGVTSFIAPYLRMMGIKKTVGHSWFKWLRKKNNLFRT